MRFAILSTVSLFASGAIAARTFTVQNKCSYTVWPAVSAINALEIARALTSYLQIFTDLNVGTAKPSSPTGWEAKPGSKVTFAVPDNWSAGRIWGRRGCDFSKNPGPLSCATGGCNGGLLCDPRSGTGVPPATVAEFTLGGFNGGDDWYDVSLVDGFNIPMQISNTVGCSTADCPADLNPNCPNPLKGPFDKSGTPLGCKSACFANLDGNQGNSGNCCSGSHSTPQTCPRSGVQYYDYFKSGCRNSYVYAYDESSGTALFQCSSKKKADYTVTFCP